MSKTVLVSIFAAATATASACDLCACDLPLIRLEHSLGWHAGVSTQFTDYDRLSLDGSRIGNPEGQRMRSAITQFSFGREFAHGLGVQVNLPFIHRSFRRVEDGVTESGSVSGFGDLSATGMWRALEIERGNFLLTARVSAGIKFPTGDSDRLREESEHGHGGHEAEEAEHGHGEEHEAEHHGEGEDHHEEAPASSGVHGHDLALGTGSVDGIFGADVHCQYHRWYLDAGLQVAVRGNGDHDYDYADELSWYAGLGFVLVENEALNAGIGVRFSGETKGEDEFRGQRLKDTSATNIFAGPRFHAIWRERLSMHIGAEFPISQENSGVQTTPEFRLQAGVGWQF